MASSFLRALSGETPSQVDMHGGVGLGLRALSMVPGPVGWLGTLAGLGVRGNNVGYANAARRSWGQGGLDFGQTAGGVLGLNSYGGGGETDRLGEFRGTPVAPGGMVSSGGFLGIGATNEGAYTPGEAQRRNAASLYGSSFGVPQQTAPAPAPVQQAAPVSAPAAAPAPVQRTNILGVAQDQPDPFDRQAIARVIQEFNNGGGGGGIRAGGGSMGGRGGYGGRNSDGSSGGRSGADLGGRSSIN